MSDSYLLKSIPHQGVQPTFHLWRTLFSGSSEVGVFRLKQGTDYIDREIEFKPLLPVALSETSLGDYLEREFHDLGVEIDGEGGVSIRLGPNQMLGPIASRVAYVYKKLLSLKKGGNKNEDKQGEQKQKA